MTDWLCRKRSRQAEQLKTANESVDNGVQSLLY